MDSVMHFNLRIFQCVDVSMSFRNHHANCRSNWLSLKWMGKKRTRFDGNRILIIFEWWNGEMNTFLICTIWCGDDDGGDGNGGDGVGLSRKWSFACQHIMYYIYYVVLFLQAETLFFCLFVWTTSLSILSVHIP